MNGIIGFTSVPSITHQAGAPFTTAAVHFAKADENNEDDDDDWRAFRAKLVMSETAAASETSTETSTEPIADEDDPDGFGALFAQKTQKEKAFTTSEPKFTIPEGFTPLDPTQWAYDSGRYIIEKLSTVLYLLIGLTLFLPFYRQHNRTGSSHTWWS
jgi:hypothetical protein